MTSQQALALRARLGTSLARTLRYRGMLVLVIWQAPIQPVIQPNGSFGLVIGAGTDEYAQLACDGSLLSSEPIRYRVAAAQADYDLNTHARIEAAVGIMSSDHASHDLGFGGVRLRGDWQSFGIGAGIVIGPGLYRRGSEALPSGHVRVGSAEGLHGRWDLVPPMATGTQQIGRIGLGYNAVARDQPAWFIGVAALGSSVMASGVAAEVTLPVAGRFALRAEGHYAPGHGHPVSALTVGGRFLLEGRGGPARVDHDREP